MMDRQPKLPHPPIGYRPIVHWAIAQCSPGKCSTSALERFFSWVTVRRVFTSALISSAVVLKIVAGTCRPIDPPAENLAQQWPSPRN
jgi:hypothetical protein